MPTNKKRVGFIPREDVLKIIDRLSTENNLSNSKIISILVEEALSIRGIFNKETGKLTQSFHGNRDNPHYLFKDSANLKENDKFTINNNSINHKNSNKTNLLKQISQEGFDMQTYKKFISFLKFQELMNEFNG